jgi:hypothetical protein
MPAAMAPEETRTTCSPRQPAIREGRDQGLDPLGIEAPAAVHGQ